MSIVVEFDHYFPNLTNNKFVWKLVQNPLHIDVEMIPETLQEEAIDLKCDFCAKINFEAMSLEYYPIYPKVGEETLRLMVPFSFTYLCKVSFSTLALLKTKPHNRLDIEIYSRCALSSFRPRTSNLVKEKQQ